MGQWWVWDGKSVGFGYWVLIGVSGSDRWPSQFAVEKLPRPVATVSFAAQLLADVTALDPRLPLRHRAEVTALQDGFFVEMRQLWSGATLVALNQQTLALLK